MTTMRDNPQHAKSLCWANRVPLRFVAGVAALVVILTPAMTSADNAKVRSYAKAPHAEKINTNLLELEDQVRQGAISLSRAATRMAIQTTGEGIQVDIVMNRIDDDVLAAMREMGLSIQYVSEAHRRLTAIVDDLAVLYEVAALEAVEMIMPEYGGATQRGSVDGRASEAMLADVARLSTSLSGAGQTVGILSDSFARTEQVRDADTVPAVGSRGTLRHSKPQKSGDLPSTVAIRRDDGGGGDEGAGMAELVHDIAPGAAIAFHTAFGGQAVFAEGITDLCTTAGSTVVVDDVLYFAEPMYQDGIIAQAAAHCVGSGVPFFSAAGNQSNRGFRQIFKDLDPADDRSRTPTGNDLHDWGGGDGFLDITLPPSSAMRVVLQWNQPFASVNPSRGAQIDLDLYITPSPDAAGLNHPIVSSIGQQGSTGNPRGDALEIIAISNLDSSPMTVYLAVEHYDGNQEVIPQNSTTPLEFRLVFFESNFRNTSIQGILDHTSAFGGPTIYGHAVAPGVVSVAAVPWFDTAVFNPAFTPSNAADPEDFSSRGGAISVQFDASGTFVPRTSQEPDIAAVDGNNTTFFGLPLDLKGYEGEPDAFPNFFGTSAAAPNAAAVAALMREYHGALTPAEILMAMVNTAIDIKGARASVGPDDVTGAGLIDANAAIGALQRTPEGTIDTPSGNISIETGDAVYFSGSGTSPDGHVPLSFFWNFGGGAESSAQEDPGHVTFNKPGTFSVTFTVSDSQGNSDPTPASLTVTVSDPVTVSPVAVNRSSSGGGGGGCTLDPNGGTDFTLLIALIGALAYVAWRRGDSRGMC
jgi:hypothetical protein